MGDRPVPLAGTGWSSDRAAAMIGPVDPSAAELSSIATGLDDIVRRVTAHAEAARSAGDDERAGELFAVERALAGAHRRLVRMTHAPLGSGSARRT